MYLYNSFFVSDKPNDVVDRRQLRVQYERGVGECNEVISGAIQQPRLPLYVHFYANILTLPLLLPTH